MRRSVTQRSTVHWNALRGSRSSSVTGVSTVVDTSHTARPLRSLSATSPSTCRVMVIFCWFLVRRAPVSK
ncbi:hypothetical protein SRIMM317S_06829 [Streptomyces rimosus subsp. rimosus]